MAAVSSEIKNGILYCCFVSTKKTKQKKTVTIQILDIIPKDTLIRQLMQPQSVTYTF